MEGREVCVCGGGGGGGKCRVWLAWLTEVVVVAGSVGRAETRSI